jgi:hypothetical protein
MKLYSSISYLLLTVALSSLFSSCTKEIITETVKRDSIIVRKDSIIIKQDVPKLFVKKWNLVSHEIEQYSGSIMTNKTVENFSAIGYYNEFKSNGTYTFFDRGGNITGSWELLSDNYYVLDKNTSNERYYYILSISQSNLINRGPFTKTNQLLTNILFSAYFKTAQ